MPTHVSKVFPDGAVEVVDYIYPGEKMCITTDGFNGEINRAIIIKCLEFDTATEIYDAPPELGNLSPDILEKQCTQETLAESFDGTEEARRISMHDNVEGQFHLVLRRCFEASYN